jgi:hypothetical protein
MIKITILNNIIFANMIDHKKLAIKPLITLIKEELV